MKRIKFFARGVVFLALVFSFVLAGCAPAAETAEEPAQQEAAKPSEMNIATYLTPDDPLSKWDPAAASGAGAGVHNNMYETLLLYDAQKDEMIYVLATSYTKSDDGLVWTFKIREGVKFHDGTDLDAEAVRFSIQRYIDIGTGGAYMWDPVETISVLDPYTVEFKLKYPAPLDLIAAAPYVNFIMSPTTVKAHPDDWLAQGNEAGSGPYMLKSYKLGEEVVLEKFPDYWKGWKEGQFDIIDYKYVAESATRRQLLEKGDADITVKLPPEDLDVLKTNSKLQVITSPTFNLWYLFLNNQKPPLDNALVRQALSYAFPYEETVQYAFGGYASQSRGALPATLWGHGKDLLQYNYDLEKAKALLSEAGIPDGGFTLQANYQSGDESVKRMMEQYKAELAKLNITLDMRATPWDTMWEQAKSSDLAARQDIYVAESFPDYPDPYSLLYIAFHSEESVFLNLGYYYNPKFDELIDNAFVTSATDREKAAEMYVEAQKMLVDEAASIFTVDIPVNFVVNSTLQGFTPNPTYFEVVYFYDTYRAKE